MTEATNDSLESEFRVHRYQGTKIPIWVRALWVGFWIFAISYTIRFMIPALQKELGPSIPQTTPAMPN